MIHFIILVETNTILENNYIPIKYVYFIYIYIYLSIYLSTYLSIYLSIYTHTGIFSPRGFKLGQLNEHCKLRRTLSTFYSFLIWIVVCGG